MITTTISQCTSLELNGILIYLFTFSFMQDTKFYTYTVSVNVGELSNPDDILEAKAKAITKVRPIYDKLIAGILPTNQSLDFGSSPVVFE